MIHVLVNVKLILVALVPENVGSGFQGRLKMENVPAIQATLM
jgi:hypothetical protein